MAIDWTNLTPSEFEELCYSLVEANGFKELRWYGKGGGDKGRDILAKKETAYTERMSISENWVIQCKRYTAQPPGIELISSFLEKCREHKPDNVLLIISNTLSSATKDWIDSVRSDYRYRIHLWEEMELIREMKSHRDALSQKAIDLMKQIAPPPSVPVHFSPISSMLVYYITDIDEFEELGIFILNDYGQKQNMEWIKEFVEYIRTHDVVFESFDDKNNSV